MTGEVVVAWLSKSKCVLKGRRVLLNYGNGGSVSFKQRSLNGMISG